MLQVSKSLRVGIFAAPMAGGEKEEVTAKEGRLTVIIESGSVTVVSEWLRRRRAARARGLHAVTPACHSGSGSVCQSLSAREIHA